jgi:hypothetical protein
MNESLNEDYRNIRRWKIGYGFLFVFLVVLIFILMVGIISGLLFIFIFTEEKGYSPVPAGFKFFFIPFGILIPFLWHYSRETYDNYSVMRDLLRREKETNPRTEAGQ